MPNVGILGLGAYLPETVRHNDWWPRPLVERWRQAARAAAPTGLPAGRQLVMETLARMAGDPFQGARERRVLSDEMLPSDAETRAAADALEAARVEPKDIDLVLSSSFVPDVLNVPNAFAVQRNLGIGGRCFSTGIEAACNAFPMQVALAARMISSGLSRFALLTQSSVLSRVLPYDEPFSTYFGDGATAVVLGPVSAHRGLLGESHFSDGDNCGALYTSVPGKRWYEEGRSYWHHGDKRLVFEMLLKVPEVGAQAIDAALADAGVDKKQVAFFACHQGTPWFRESIQQFAGLDGVRTLDTFPWTGSLIGANVALVLLEAQCERMIADDDVVLTFASGVGSTWSSQVFRWGR